MDKPWKIYFVPQDDNLTSYVYITYGGNPIGMVKDFKIGSSTEDGSFISMSFTQILCNNYEIKTITQAELDLLYKS